MSKEACIVSKEACIVSKEAYIVSKEAYIVSKEAYIVYWPSSWSYFRLPKPINRTGQVRSLTSDWLHPGQHRVECHFLYLIQLSTMWEAPANDL